MRNPAILALFSLLAPILNGKIMLNAQLDISAIHQHDKAAAMNPPNPAVAAIRLGVRALMSSGSLRKLSRWTIQSP